MNRPWLIWVAVMALVLVLVVGAADLCLALKYSRTEAVPQIKVGDTVEFQYSGFGYPNTVEVVEIKGNWVAIRIMKKGVPFVRWQNFSLVNWLRVEEKRPPGAPSDR